MVLTSSVMRAWAIEIASVFSLSFVWHQHESLSYTSWSVSISSLSCFDMSFSRLMTLVTGRSLSALLSKVALARASSKQIQRIAGKGLDTAQLLELSSLDL